MPQMCSPGVSTYLGGSGVDLAGGVGVDGSGNAYVVGRTISADFPTCDAFQPVIAGSSDAFLLRIDCLLGGPVVGPVADAGPPLTICVGETVTLDASASLPCDASGLEYRWLEGAIVVPGCDWSTTPTCDVTPPTTTTYTLQISCIGNPAACITTDDLLVIVIVEPDLVPPDIGNTIRAIRSTSNVAMSWVSVVNARTYHLYRGTAKEVWPPPLLPVLTATTETLPDVPGPPDLYFYRVTGASCSGMEGP